MGRRVVNSLYESGSERSKRRLEGFMARFPFSRLPKLFDRLAGYRFPPASCVGPGLYIPVYSSFPYFPYYDISRPVYQQEQQL